MGLTLSSGDGGIMWSGSSSRLTRVGKVLLCLWYIKKPNTRTTASPNIGTTEYSKVCTVLFFVVVEESLVVEMGLVTASVDKIEKNNSINNTYIKSINPPY